jgi:hypothetical protein
MASVAGIWSLNILRTIEATYTEWNMKEDGDIQISVTGIQLCK